MKRQKRAHVLFTAEKIKGVHVAKDPWDMSQPFRPLPLRKMGIRSLLNYALRCQPTAVFTIVAAAYAAFRAGAGEIHGVMGVSGAEVTGVATYVGAALMGETGLGIGEYAHRRLAALRKGKNLTQPSEGEHEFFCNKPRKSTAGAAACMILGAVGGYAAGGLATYALAKGPITHLFHNAQSALDSWNSSPRSKSDTGLQHPQTSPVRAGHGSLLPGTRPIYVIAKNG
jgi:hypothetical protein